MRLRLTFVFRLSHKQKLKMSDESSANKRFLTIDERELRRLLEVKDSKNTRRATNGAMNFI